MLLDANLDGFFSGKREFWKKGVAWNTRDVPSSPAPVPVATTALFKAASGGSIDLEKKLTEKGAQTVEDLLLLIVSSDDPVCEQQQTTAREIKRHE